MKPISTQVRPAFVFVLCMFGAAISTQAQRGRNYYRHAAFYPAYGQRFVSMPGAYVSLNFGGNPYYYAGGNFYRPNGGYFQVTFPPFGLHVGILPTVYHPVIWGGNPYYYSNGVFYRPSPDTRDYEVVQAPIGAEVPFLPAETKTMVIDGEKFYSLNGTYFKDLVKPNGELWYRVVGKNGVLNTFRNEDNYQQMPRPEYPQQEPQRGYPQQAPQNYPQPAPQYSYPQPRQEQQQPAPVQQQPVITQPAPVQPAVVVPQSQSTQTVNGVREAVRRNQQSRPVTEEDEDTSDSTQWSAPDLILHDNPGLGWVVDRLPKDCKTVTINNKKYYLAPDNTYYEEFVDGRQVRYKVAGK
ncbi:DUF6515 family protein [Sediminibacterium soli]|uniref:DUF6515 family protein n=1 Tax=Sediminibacterium soli TaxID=2698829 RepID=UPI00137A2755|nr:DUF6515 family protein [Sediminibacterium soli]NCI45128.1 hypothetical protein [Sediminibacterium soli]